jgi:uncharacterized protein
MEAADIVSAYPVIRDLSRAECVSALRTQTLGRIAVSERALPMILPVTYTLDGSNVVFRTRPGGLLDRSCQNSVVAFEVDDRDPDTGAGWSVLMVGVASALFAGDCLPAVDFGLMSKGAGEGELFVKIVPGTVTGRAIERSAVPVLSTDQSR